MFPKKTDIFKKGFDMKRKNYSPADYLKNVLANWSEFCKTHRRLTNAILDVLTENERLKAELKESEKRNVKKDY